MNRKTLARRFHFLRLHFYQHVNAEVTAHHFEIRRLVSPGGPLTSLSSSDRSFRLLVVQALMGHMSVAKQKLTLNTLTSHLMLCLLSAES